MAVEETMTADEKALKRRGDAFAGGIFLIGLGVLLATGWWWPGIMVVLGLSGGAGLIFRGKILAGIGTLAFFIGIGLAVEIVRATDISGVLIGGMILIGIGVIVITKTFLIRDI